MSTDLPELALSVRQPWAWAIIHGGKTIENRTMGAIRSGSMDCRRICIHAASGMSEKEYRWGAWKLSQVGVTAPRPEALYRSAIVGIVDVVDIITDSDSPWFGGPCGLVLEHPQPVEPIPAKGALGYFRWKQSGAMAPPKPWMSRYDLPSGDRATGELFPGLAPSFATPPEKPFPPRKKT